MKDENTIKKPRRVLRAILKGLSLTAAVIAVALITWHFVWTYSGSNTWVREFEKNGVTVYSLKTPGVALKQFKAVTRVKTTLTRATAAMASTDAEDCNEWAPGCTSEKAIQPWSSDAMAYTHLFRLTFPSPFSPREFLIHAHVTQDQPTKAVLVRFEAAPDALPRNPCCVRVETLHNWWKFTPLGNGQVEVEALMNADQGLPYPMVNHFVPFGLYSVCHDLQAFLDKPKWQNARFDRIQEQ